MKVAELYQGYSGELFEILSFSDNAACIISANTGVYSAVAKPLIDNYTIDWRFKYDFITQEKAINVTKELRQMYFNFEDKNRVRGCKKTALKESRFPAFGKSRLFFMPDRKNNYFG